MPTVGSIGETALIERLAARVRSAGLAQPSGAQVVLGIGDDAAAWRMDGIEASSIDTMVEGVHFRTATASWADIGWKAWVSNVSDMAAMGAEPVAGLIALGLPAELAVEDVDALYDGMLEACAAYGTLLLGGDIVGSPVVFVTVAMTGRCEDAPLTRDAARAGDAVAVTGPLGASRGGLLLSGRRAGARQPGARASGACAPQTDGAPGHRPHASAIRRSLCDGYLGRPRGRPPEACEGGGARCAW